MAPAVAAWAAENAANHRAVDWRKAIEEARSDDAKAEKAAKEADGKPQAAAEPPKAAPEPPKEVTEAATEAVTEERTEVMSKAMTEAMTEAMTKAMTKAITESMTEAMTEAATEAVTEAMTEAITKAATVDVAAFGEVAVSTGGVLSDATKGAAWQATPGRQTWFFLHTLAAKYPDFPSGVDQVTLGAGSTCLRRDRKP
jgi:nucleoid DNA-binding protein